MSRSRRAGCYSPVRIPNFPRGHDGCSARPVRLRRVVLPGSLRPGQAKRSALLIPAVDPLLKPIDGLRVTEFRDYLACPYRYYLKHRLGLVALTDGAEELDAGRFGELLHDVLREFGESEVASAIDPEAIHDQLFVSLGELAARRFGETPQPAVRVQIELLQLRLKQFAERQAEWRRQGWLIEDVELNFTDQDAPFIVDGKPIYLRGRIDRIDKNERTGEFAVLDYKSSETAKSPAAVHCKQNAWIDLQLPLYRHLAMSLKKDPPMHGEVRLGYILLPKNPGGAKFELAAWTPAELEEADRTAAHVVRQIRGGVFGPPTVPAPEFFEDFAAICQDDQFGAACQAMAESEEGAA